MPKNANPLRPIYIMYSLQGFALSLIGIFIPIYFLTLGYSVSQVLVFYILHYVCLVAFAFAAIYPAKFVGPQRTFFSESRF